MIRAIALDDEPLALPILKAFSERTGHITMLGTFTRPDLALEYLKTAEVDLIFLDINMPLISGIEFYKELQKDTMVIFTTAHTEFAVESYELNAVDYLLKPFDYERFLKSVERAKEYHNFRRQKGQEAGQYLFVKVDYSITRVPIADIRYIEGQDNYVKIFLDNGKYLLVRMSMKAMQEQLPASAFIRVHRSYIVSLKKVTAIRNKTIHMEHAPEIPISALYLEDVMKHFL